MVKRMFLTIICGATLCVLSFAQETTQNMLPPESSSQEILNAPSVTPAGAKMGGKEAEKSSGENNNQGPAQPLDEDKNVKGQPEGALPQEANALAEKSDQNNSLMMKTQYKGGKMTEWQLYDDKERLISRVAYNGHQPVTIQTFDSNGKLMQNDYKAFYPNGNLALVATFKSGIQTATNGYYENGQLRYKLKKSKDGTVTMFREYGQDGQLKNGEYKEYYPDGKLKGVGNFQKGLPDGSFISFCEDGKVVAQKQFRKGHLLSQSWEREPTCDDAFMYLDSGVRPIIAVVVKKDQS